jgi:tetratricopeptide (TPR) repeat protein
VDNLGAYDLYLRAASLRATLSKNDVMKALELLDRALALDPYFAPALALAAGCHSQMYLNSWDDDRESHRITGLRLAERAERAGSDDASVLTAVANAVVDLGHTSDHYIDRAQALVARATSLNPGLAQGWFVSGMLKLMSAKDAGAIDDLERAARLDPISSLHGKAKAHIGVGQVLQGNFEEALGNLLATSVRSPRIQLLLAFTYERLGHLEQAHEALRHYEQQTSIPAETMAEQMTTRAPQLRQLRDSLARLRNKEVTP